VWGEFGHLILNYVDRYLIAFFLGSAPLGLYTAGYNLATYLTEVLICPINYAITPVYMSILVNKGEKETKEFFTKMFRYFLLIIFPVMLGFIATGKEVIAVMASKKYLESYSIMTIIVVGQAIYASTLILNNGLFIKNKTYIYRNIMLFTCLLNIALNTILIPKYGILGSAFATLISYAIYSIVITYYAFKEFSFKIEWHSTIIYAGSSLIMFVTVKCISIASLLLHIFSQITIGALVYISIVVLLDKALRRNLLLFLARLRSRHT
jgi:O-antigen/teichoic acid export membrane protein